MGHTWAGADGLRGEGDVLGLGHYKIEKKERLKTTETVEGVLRGSLCIL